MPTTPSSATAEAGALILLMHEFARVWNLATAYWSDVRCWHGHNRCRLAGQSDELDLVSFVAWINVNHCSNIARLKALLGEGFGENYSVVFVNHARKLL